MDFTLTVYNQLISGRYQHVQEICLLTKAEQCATDKKWMTGFQNKQTMTNKEGEDILLFDGK